MSRPDPRDEGSTAPSAASKGETSGHRPLARLAELSAHLPSLPRSQEAGPPAAGIDPGSALARALAGRIVLSRDSRGRGGKTVTFARGIVASPKLQDQLARELRRELGTGVRCEDGALIVQGALTERLAAALAKRGAARIVIGN